MIIPYFPPGLLHDLAGGCYKRQATESPDDYAFEWRIHDKQLPPIDREGIVVYSDVEEVTVDGLVVHNFVGGCVLLVALPFLLPGFPVLVLVSYLLCGSEEARSCAADLCDMVLHPFSQS